MGRLVVSPAEIMALRELRKQSQKEAAWSIGYTPLSWRQWEKGNTVMPACAWVVYQQGGLMAANAYIAGDARQIAQLRRPSSIPSPVTEELFSDSEWSEILSALGDNSAPAPVTPKLTAKDAMVRMCEMMNTLVKEITDED